MRQGFQVSSGTPGKEKVAPVAVFDTRRSLSGAGDFRSVAEVFTYLAAEEAAGRIDGVEIVVGAGHWPVSDTAVVDFSFPVMFRGAGSIAVFLRRLPALRERQCSG